MTSNAAFPVPPIPVHECLYVLVRAPYIHERRQNISLSLYIYIYHAQYTYIYIHLHMVLYVYAWVYMSLHTEE